MRGRWLLGLMGGMGTWLVYGAAILAAVIAGAGSAFALGPGDTVRVLIPADGDQPEPDPGPPTDLLVVTGGKVTAVDTTPCIPGTFSLQNAVLVDPGAGRSGRIIGVINITQIDPLPPATRLTRFTFELSCTAAGTAYKQYITEWECGAFCRPQ